MIRKVLVQLLHPVSILVFFGVVISLRKKSALFFLLSVVLYFISITPVADKLLAPLEAVCPSVYVKKEKVKKVVILSGGVFERKDSISSLSCSSLKRLLCALNVCNSSNCTLYISGGITTSKRPEAEVLFDVAKRFSKANIVVEKWSKITAEHPQKLFSLLKGSSFYLVTSAYHVKRALFLFKKAKLNPIPYCCDYLREKRYIITDYIPHHRNIRKVALAIHEYLGLLYYKFKFSLFNKNVNHKGKKTKSHKDKADKV